MKVENYINYQGSKSNIIDFIISGIEEYTDEGDTIFDIFSGSGAVSQSLAKKYNVVANDVEPYASTISKAILNSHQTSIEDVLEIMKIASTYFHYLVKEESLNDYINSESKYLKEQNLSNILALYKSYPTIWNNSELTPAKLQNSGRFNLFTRYYGGTYFGIKQAVEIDSLIYSFSEWKQDIDLLYSCLFYSMKESVFSKDGHMAQPLNFERFSKRGFISRDKSIFENFNKKLNDIINEGPKIYTHNIVYNQNFEELIKDEEIIKNIDLIYADPPYTDMQYSRYYHILNVARLYNFPEPTINSRGFTSGLYTEGRYQSELSQKSKAKSRIKLLMEVCHNHKKNLALSYAYPKNLKTQATDRYTVSIEELLNMAKEIFGAEYVKVNQINHTHANNKKSTSKPVIEYLILCGKNKKNKKTYDLTNVKNKLLEITPTNRNPMYNTHLYWSQKSFNITDILIKNLSEPGEIIFDPFMGSGVTMLESIKNKNDRIAIGCDVNEMPIFIVETLLDSSFNNSALIEVKNAVKNIKNLNSYYEIECPKCHGKAVIDRVVFDKPIRNQNKIDIKTVSLNCVNCSSTNIEDTNDVILNQMYYPYSYKNIDVNYTFLKNSKIAVLENDKITNIFTYRNLKVIDEILDISKNLSTDAQKIIKYILMSFMHQCKITDKRSNSQWPLWIPKRDCVERNIITIFEKKLNNFIKATKFIHNEYKNNSIVDSFDLLEKNKTMLLHKGSQHISTTDFPDNSVDLIITDPPYLEQVLYSEYMQLYAPILNLSYNLEDEIIVSSGESRNKDKTSYYTLLQSVFKICSNKLKKDKFLCLYFHDSDLSVWNELIKSLYESGFHFKGQVHIKKNATLKNIISPKKSLNGDSILFFTNSKIEMSYADGKESIDEIEANIIREAKHMLRNNSFLSTPELYDNGLMEILIQNGWLNKISKKYKSLVELFEKHIYWDKSIGKWKLNEKE